MNAIQEKPEIETLRLAVRGSGDWVGWINQAAQSTARTRSSLFEAALIAFAKAEGLLPPPPRV